LESHKQNQSLTLVQTLKITTKNKQKITTKIIFSSSLVDTTSQLNMQNIKYFALLCGSTMANFANMEESYAALINETIQQGGMRNLGADHRAFLGSIATTLEPLTNYKKVVLKDRFS
jgi:hypothetical protein